MMKSDRQSPNPNAAQLIASAKDCLLHTLGAAGFSAVTTCFEAQDGCGSITHIRTRRDNGLQSDGAALHESPLIAPNQRATLHTLVVAFTWHVVGTCYPRALDGEGLSGTLDVDVATGAATVSASLRRLTTDTYALRL